MNRIRLLLGININKNRILLGIELYIGFIVLGFIMNVLAFMIPDANIHVHVKDAATTFSLEGDFPELIKGYSSSVPDNNTDAWMLLMADYQGQESAIEKAMANYFRGYIDDRTIFVGTVNLPHIDEQPVYRSSYTRYWNGWIFPLRLALFFCSYSDIRMFLFILQFFFTVLLFVQMQKRHVSYLSIPLAVSLILYLPITAVVSMDYSVVYLITLLVLIIIISFYDKIERDFGGFSVLFLLIGMVTSYYDFLTMPLITLGLPLIVLIEIEFSHGKNKHTFNRIILYSALWGIGYLGMWAMKWVLSFWITGYDISNAIDQARFRSSKEVDGYPITYYETVMRNLKPIMHKPIKILLLAAGFEAIFSGFRRRRSLRITVDLNMMFSLAIIAIYPFVWWFLMMNHSFIHCHFTYRSIIISVFAVLLFVKHLFGYYKHVEDQELSGQL